MQIEKLPDAQRLIIDYLNSSYLEIKKDYCGWGVCKSRNAISITNTAEAIITYKEIDALQDDFLSQKNKNLISYLLNQLLLACESEEARTRDIAYASLALDILGVKDHKKTAVEKLLSMSNEKGGWPEFLKLSIPSLVPTYHALSTLQNLEENIEEKHYLWLTNLFKSNNLCTFAPGDIDTHFGASCLVLFLISNSPYSDRAWVTDLARNIYEQLFRVFEKMARQDESWISNDPHTNFKIYGYGHGLIGLNLLGFDLFQAGIDKFLSADFKFDRDLTWIPEVLEFSLALRAIGLNFDPFQYFKTTKKQVITSVETRISSEKERLVAEGEKIKKRQALIDEWEKDLIRQRREIQELTNDIKSIIPELITTKLDEFLNKEKKSFKRGFRLHFILITIFLLGSFTTILKVITGTFSLKDLGTSIAMFFAIVAIIFEIINIWKK